MTKIKLYCHENGELLFSRHWPQVPEIKASIYADEWAMNRFNKQMKFMIYHKVVVTNPDFAKKLIGKEPEEGNFYTVTCDAIIEGSKVTLHENKVVEDILNMIDPNEIWNAAKPREYK